MSAAAFYFRLKNLSTVTIFNSSVLKCNKNSLVTYGEITTNFRTANFTTSRTNPKESTEENDDSKKKKGKVFIRGDGVEVKKKMPDGPKIMVIDLMGSKTSMYMENAEKIARRNNWKLVFEEEKNNKKIYRFITGHQSNKRLSNADIKKITFGNKISSHDTDVKIKNISKSLQKGKKISVVIEGTSNNSAEMERILKHIEKSLGTDAKIIGIKKSSLTTSFMVQPSEISLKPNENDENSVENKENHSPNNSNTLKPSV